MSHADPLWNLDERLSDDPCSVWLSSRNTGHKGQTSTPTQLLNDVNVCQARQWGPRLLKLLPHNIPRTSSSSAPSTVEEPLPWNQRAPVTAPSQNSKVPPSLQGITHRASPSHLHSEAVTVQVSTEKETTHIRLPSPSLQFGDVPIPTSSAYHQRLHGYIQPLTPWDDAIRFLVAGTSPRAQDSAGPFHATNDGALVLLPSWKCRGSASLLQQYGYLHAQFWPSSSSSSSSSSPLLAVAPTKKRQQWSDDFPWAANVGLYLHHAIVRRRDHRPLLSTLEEDAVHDGQPQPFSSQWLKSCGIGLEVIPSRDPRWTLRSTLHQLSPVDPLLRLAHNSKTSSCESMQGIDDASRSSSRQYSVGASYDSTTQRSRAGRRSVLWRFECGGQVATNSTSPASSGGDDDDDALMRPSLSYEVGTGIWTRGVMETMLSLGVVRRQGRGIDDASSISTHHCVLRARWFGALRPMMPWWGQTSPNSSTATRPLLEVPHGLLRGLTFGELIEGQPDTSLQHVVRTTSACGITAASLEAQFLRLFGAGADLTLFFNMMLCNIPSSMLWSAGYSFSPTNNVQQPATTTTSSGGGSRQGHTSEWNTWIPQRMECAFPVAFGSSSRGDLPVASQERSSVSWMPRCGIVWSL